MPYDLFEERPDGAFDFTDSATGQTIALPPTPAVRARVAALGAAAADAGLARAVTTNGSAERAYRGPEQTPGTNQVLPGAPQAPIELVGPAGEPLRLAQAAPPAQMSAPPPDPVSRAEWTTAPEPAPAGMSTPEPLMSVAPPAPPAAPSGPRVDPGKVRMAQPQGGGFSGPAGAGSFQAPDLSELSEAEGLEVGLRRRKMAQLERGSYTPSSPEREQRVSVNRERRLGPDPDIIREMEAIETGAVPFKLPDELRKPLPTITTSEVKDLFAPPVGKNGKPLKGKELDAWAQSVATDAQEKGYSPATLATMLPARMAAPPKNAPGEVLDAWEKEQAAAHAAKVAAADKRSVDVRAKYDALVGSIVAGEQTKADDWVRRFGTYGMAGAEMRNAAIEKGLQQDAADAEVQRAGYTDAYARQREAILLRQRDKLAAIESQTKDLDAKLAKGIDPDRFWKSKNTSEQVGLAIAMALGAIGSQMAKGPNYAQDAINASVQRDIDAQREELANGRQAKSDMQLAYKQVMDLTGSEMAATAAMEHAAYQGIEHDLQRKLALAKSERAEIQGNALLAKIRKDQLQRQAVISEAARGSEATASRVIPAQRGGYSGPNLDKMIEQAKAIREIAGSGAKLRGDVQADVAKAAKDATGGHLPERVVFGGITYQMENVTSPAEGAKARDAMRALDTMAHLRQKMAEEARNYGTRLWNPGKFAQYAESYKYQESKATEQGVVRDPEMERHLSNVGSFRGGPDVIKALESSELAMRENALRQWGAVPVGRRLPMPDAPAPPTVTMATPEGELVAVPAAQARDLYLSGKLGFVEGESVPVAVEGKTEFLPADQAGRALETSYTASVKGTAQAQREKRLDELGGVGGTLAAAGIEAGNQLLLGAGKGIVADLVDPHFWPEAHEKTKAYLRDVEEANPLASGIGGAAGLVLPLLASGGTAAGARGLARGAAAGEAAALARAGAGAVEGAEAVSAAARARGLFGAGIDAATALPRGVGAVGDFAGGLAERGAVALGAREGGALAKITRTAAQGAAEMPFYSVGDAVTKAALHDEELTAEKLAAAAGHGFLWGAALGGGLGAAGQIMAGAGRAAKAGAAKAGELAERLGVDVPKTLEGFAERKAIQATGATKGQTAKLAEMGPEIEARVARQMTEDVPRLTGKADLATVSKAEIAEASPLLRKEKGEAIGKLVTDLDKIEGVAGPDLSRITSRIEKEVEAPLRESMFTSHYADTIAGMREKIAERASKGEIGFEGLWKERRTLDDLVYKNKIAEGSLNEQRAKVRDIIEDEIQRAATAAAEQGGSGAGAEWAAKYAQAKSEYRAAKWLDDAAAGGAAGEARNRSYGFSEHLGTIQGLMLGGPAGAVAGLAGAVAQNMVRRYGDQVAATIATKAVKSDLIRAVSDTVTARIGGSVDRFIGGGKVSRAGLAAQVDADVGRSRKASAAAYERERAELAGFLAAPDARLAAATRGLDPGTANAVRATALRAAGYLQSKAPPGELAPNPLAPGRGTPQASPAARDAFLRAARAVKDPMSVVDDFEHGRLTREGVDALRATSPRLLGEIQAAVLGRIAEKGPPESYAKSLQLGILLGIPTDATLEPAFVAKVQATYAPTPPAAGPDGAAAPVRRIGPINAASTEMTRTERLLSGK